LFACINFATFYDIRLTCIEITKSEKYTPATGYAAKTPTTKTAISQKWLNIFAYNFQTLLGGCCVTVLHWHM